MNDMYNVYFWLKYLMFFCFFNDLDILYVRKIFWNILMVFFLINDFDILYVWKIFWIMYIWVCFYMFFLLCIVGFFEKVVYVFLNKGICKIFFGIFFIRSCINWVLVVNIESVWFLFMFGYMIFVYLYLFGKYWIIL